MIKKVFVVLFSFLMLLASTSLVFAHVVVTPNEVGVAKSQTFTIGVPTEKDNPTVAVRLVLPNGLQEVAPDVKPGWSIAVKKTGDTVNEIDWTGGTIPTDERDEFSFSAQVPDKPTTLQWKAYQTYQDGSIVSWDQKPNGSDDASGDKGPFSETKIVDDLSSTNSDKTTTYVAYGALVVALIALFLALQMRLVRK